MEKYSGHDPFWRMAHNYLLWAKVFRTMGLTPERLLSYVKPGEIIPYMSYEDAIETVREMAEYFVSHSDFPKWREVITENRAHEDYDSRKSSVKIDFHRKWYHTRAKVKVLDFAQVDEPSYYPYDNIVSRLDVERFTSRLDYKNKRIVKLLLEGYTQVEIAEMIGFANHSGVCKRIKKIGEAFLEYMKPST
jgi:hypothetical protein